LRLDKKKLSRAAEKKSLLKSSESEVPF
jgi:hypothetical protein